MRIHTTLAAVAAALIALAPVQAQEQEGDPIVDVSTEDARMNAAIAEAQATLPEWLAVLADPPLGTQYIAFKYPLEGWEHIWVGNVRRDGDYLTGNLNNAPHSEGWSLGDPVRVSLSDVSDWTYTDAAGYTHGHRTTRVLFDQLPPEVVTDLKRQFGWE